MARDLDRALRRTLCEAAVAYAAGGWPILPTRGPEFVEPVCLRPARAVDEVREWWSDRAYGIACPTGDLFDTVAVSAAVGRGMLPRLTEHHLPVLHEYDHEGTETWQFLVTPGSPLITDLPRDSPVRLVSRGRLVLLPPTPVAGGVAQWVAHDPRARSRIRVLPAVTPEVVSLRTLPHSLQIQWTALRVIVAARNGVTPEEPQDKSTLCGRLRLDYEQGATITELSKRIGRSPRYVRQQLRQAGTTFRQSGRRPAGVVWQAEQRPAD